MTCTSQTVNSSFPNNYLNIDAAFSPHIFDVQRMYAAQMIIMERHRRLLQIPTEAVSQSQEEFNSMKNVQVPHDKPKNDGTLQDFDLGQKKDNNVMQRPHGGSSNFDKIVQPRFNENEVADRRFFLEHAKCYLETKELWEKFHRLGTEMIITKTGR